uniref:Serpentine receptor class gamma n=1 Tax=Globodera rostochiensis TaxID=31243 RepID=A0A914HR40_GLORO
MDFFEWSISVQIPIIYLTICMTFPSMALYIAEIVTIVRHKKFHNSFYALFVMRAILDLLYVLDSFYGQRLPSIFGAVLYPIYSKFPNWMFAMFYFFAGHTFQANNLVTAFILLNRLTAIIMPIKHEMISLITNIDDPKTSTYLNIYYPLVMDTGTVVLSSWLLLWACSTFRQQLINDFSIIRKTNIQNIRVDAIEWRRNNNHLTVRGAVGHQLQNRMCRSAQQLPAIS